MAYNLPVFKLLVYWLVTFSGLICIFIENFTFSQVFFTHFASKNHLHSFSISGALGETELNIGALRKIM